MTTVTSGSIPMTDPLFSQEEYQRRQNAVMAKLESQGHGCHCRYGLQPPGISLRL